MQIARFVKNLAQDATKIAQEAKKIFTGGKKYLNRNSNFPIAQFVK